MNLSFLNEPQKEAVINIEGPIMAIAGAGSGKTSVLTHRLAYMIEQGIEAYNILAVTFTNKAATEMKERAKKLAGDDADLATICTFHSFCSKILRFEVEHTKYKRGFEIVDEEDSLDYIKKAIKALNLDINVFKPKIMKALISREKNGGYFSSNDKNYEFNYKRIRDLYNNLLLEDNLMDFDDMLLNTFNLFKEFEEVLYKYQRRYRYIMVDEFQDTNKIQYQLIKMLAIANRNIFIVGDEDQSIYSFRGANIENIRLFERDFKERRIIILDQNYRSNQNILNAANSVIKNNESRIKKNLFSNKKSNNLIICKRLENQYEEAQYIVDNVKRLSKTIPYKEMAVLYRSNALSRGIEEAFVRNKIPYKIFGGFSYFSRKEIKDLISYLRLLIDDSSNVAVRRLANIPKRKIGKVTLDKLEKLAKENSMSMFEAIDLAKNKGLTDFKQSILKIREMVKTKKLEEYIDVIISESGYLTELQEETDEDRESRLQNIYEFNSFILEANLEGTDNSNEEIIEHILEDIALRTDKNEQGNTESDDFVSLMTLHQSKGLEFEVIFLMAMEEGVFPSFMSVIENNIEEERRLAYVGITRAKEHLFITHTSNRMLYGQISNNDRSRFVKEIDRSCFESTKIAKVIEQKRSTHIPIEEVENDLRPGDKIKHKVFGNGVVISVSGDLAKIAFSANYGIKELLKNHPAISKLEGGK